MAVDRRLLELLVCPVSKQPVQPLSNPQLGFLNDEIRGGNVQTVNGSRLSALLREALITQDGRVIYRVEDGIPVMLPEEGIGTTQFAAFPRGA
jgi:uncharacterized protein